VIVAHIMFALGDFDSLRSMVVGTVPEKWARRERPRWWAEMISASVENASADGDARGDVEAGGDEGIGEPRVGTGEMPVGD